VLAVLELIQIFVDNIVPILMIAGIGLWIGRHFGIEPRPISTLLFYVLSPALVFDSLYTSDISGVDFVAFYAVAVLFLIVLAILAALALRLQDDNSEHAERAATILASMSSNAGNYGLSLVSFAFGPEVLSWAAIIYVASTTVNYSVGVYVASGGRSSTIRALKSVLKTPAIYGVAGAFLLRGLHIDLPLALERPIHLLANAAIPMMILLLGLQMGQSTQLQKRRLIATGVGMKLLFAPLLATLFMRLFPFPADAHIAFIAQASMPTAVMTIIIATEFDLDRDLSLNLILVSTLLSPITLSVIVFLLQRGWL
jgi:hypothetical protein